MPSAPSTARTGTARVRPLLAALLLAACRDAAGPAPGVPRPLTAGEQRAVAASNAFAFDLLRRLGAGAPGANLALSPLSGTMALGMAATGAGGETRDAMLRAVGAAGGSVEELNATQRELAAALLSLDRTVTVGVANAVFVRSTFPLRPAYGEALRAGYGAEVRNVDFATPAAAAAINEWARGATAGRIDPMFRDGELRPDLVAVLLNALYFKGSWTHRFDPARTTPIPFRTDDGRVVDAPTMTRAATPVRVGGDADVEVGELPYGNGAYAMTVLVPRHGTVDALAAALDEARWGALLGTLREQELEVNLPKFTLRSEHQWKAALAAMGMAVAFDHLRADFTAMSPECGCYLDFVKQSAVIAVDEEGTEAAAVTGVGVGPTSMPPGFRVNRSFLFAIRERTTGAILFVGRVLDPTRG